MYLSIDQSKPRDVVAFGRAAIDLYANEIGPMEEALTFSKYVGGSPANTSVAMANLGLDVGYIGMVSDDQFGRFIKAYLNKKKVDISHVELAPHGIRSGVTMGEILSASVCNCFMYRKDCADLYIRCAQLDEEYISQFKLLLISGTSLTHSPAREAVFLALAYAKRNGVRIALDLDYRDGTWDSLEEASIYLTLAAEKADLVLGTRDEFDVMEKLFIHAGEDDASAQRLLDRGVSVVSIKKGRQGSTVYAAGSVFRGGIYPAKVLKTFGAGDAYSGAFIYCLLNGIEMEETLKYAAAASAITISGHSCSDAMPTLEQVEGYMKTHKLSET